MTTIAAFHIEHTFPCGPAQHIVVYHDTTSAPHYVLGVQDPGGFGIEMTFHYGGHSRVLQADAYMDVLDVAKALVKRLLLDDVLAVAHA